MSVGIPLHPAYFAVRFRVAAVTAWPEQFAIVTAYATTGEQWTEEQNTQANAALLQRIEALGVWHVPITGYDPATGHAEPGWAIAGPLALGLQLGRAHRQDAIFAVQDGCLSVHACGSGAHADLGRFLDRVDVE
jgi:hypothetical protein